MLKIGILSGAFDPIHSGHINFIERIIQQESLDKIYLLIEKTPRHKAVFSKYEDRLEMIKIATENNPVITVYDCTVPSYPISSCLPGIKKLHSEDKVFLLVGRDVASHMKSWENAETLLKSIKLIVAERDDGITSGKIRQAIANGQEPIGLDSEVFKYILQKKLYGSETMSGE